MSPALSGRAAKGGSVRLFAPRRLEPSAASTVSVAAAMRCSNRLGDGSGMLTCQQVVLRSAFGVRLRELRGEAGAAVTLGSGFVRTLPPSVQAHETQDE